MVMEVVHEDMGEDNMQCPNHPYRNSTPGGICAYCLQEKLGKLVSSSFPVTAFPSSSSSSSSPSVRSDFNGSSTSSAPASAAALQLHHLPSSSSTSRNGGNDSYYTRKTKIPFVKKNKKKDSGGVEMAQMGNSSDSSTSIVFKRSKSTVTPRRGMNFLDEEEYSPHRRGFWSFLYLPKNSTPRKHEKYSKDLNFTPTPPSSVCNAAAVEGNDNGTPDFERRVSRSRSVGCGSRSFSGDFFERISTGFGDCTLRRVESQREGKPPKVQSGHNGQDCIKERVRCGGIFSGFLIASSSSSSSSSSYWDNSGKPIGSSMEHVSSHGRSKSWGWAFASPMRAFGKPSAGKRPIPNKNVTPNLAAIPSLLAVGG